MLRRLVSSRRRIELFQPHLKPADGGVTSCVGCGWKLQHENPKELGFQPVSPPVDQTVLLDPLHVNAHKLETRERCLCQRCWRIRHNRDIVVAAPDQGNKLKTLKDRVGVVVLIVDLSDVEGSLPANFARDVSGSNPVILVGNKVDVLPDGATDLRLRQWLKRRAEGMSLFPTGVHVTSSNTGHGIYDLVQDLAGRSENFKKDVFLCGRTNVGKSSLLNKMIRMYGGPKHLATTVSPLHGTTVGLIPVPMGHNGGRCIYDTPGLLGSDRIFSLLSRREQTVVTPFSKMRPKVYRLIPGKSLQLGEFARLDYTEGSGHLLFTTFVSSRLSNLVVATNVDKAVASRLDKPVSFVFDGNEETHSWNSAWIDVSFGGVGWISVTGRAPDAAIKLRAFGMKHVAAPVIREPLMPWEAAATELKRLERPIVKHGSVYKFKVRNEAKQHD